ncbi:MAG: hypothetical protein LBV37_02250 [Mycoplasmataceae bacterium]|jgi:hypothetical protein|nr:hypothetical protein [Mycoplasmataceae bacterium]
MATTYKIMDITKDKQLIGQDITLTKANSKTTRITLLDIRKDISKINERLNVIVKLNNLKESK